MVQFVEPLRTPAQRTPPLSVIDGSGGSVPTPDGGATVTLGGGPGNAVTTDLPDGSVVVDFGGDEKPVSSAHGQNLAELLTEQQLSLLAARLYNDYESDLRSRSEWEKTYIQGLDLLGLKFENRTEPWDGASGVFHPLLAESVVRFQSQTIQEVFPAKGPARTKIEGTTVREAIEQATRVEKYLNFLATVRMKEYRTETERLLFSLAIAGSAFRKIYFDPVKGRPCSIFIPAEDFIVNYGTTDLENAERATHVMMKSSNAVRKLQQSGFYRNVQLPKPIPQPTPIEQKYTKLTGSAVNYEERSGNYCLLEMHVNCDVPGFEDPFGIQLPYVITIDKQSRTILSIYRNWKEGDPYQAKREHFAHYQYLPGLGFYGFGLVHMIGGLSKSATSLLRQLIDAGTLANLPGGLKTKGMKIKGDDTPIMPGEFRDVDIAGGKIADNLSFLPYKEPSTVLYQLLGDVVAEGRRFASADDLKIQDFSGETPVGTTLAILEREMKVISAIQARIHQGMMVELNILAGVVRDYGPEQYPYEIEGRDLLKQDFDDRVDIIPVSDPNAGTMAQKIVRYQAALQLSQTAPQIYDMPFLHRQMLEVLGIDNADKLVPFEDEILPTDPITENMNIMTNQPVKAHWYQDHEAHIQVHMSALQNPEIVSLLSLAPDAQQKQAQLAAHIAEHTAFMYRQQVEEELGVPLPEPGEPLPEDIEYRISQLAAPAAAQLTGKAQKKAAAEEAAEKAQDPVIQQQQEKLRIEREKVLTQNAEKMAEIAKDLEIARGSQLLQRRRDDIKERLDRAKLGAQIAKDNSQQQLESGRIASTTQVEGAKLGVQIASDLMRPPIVN